MWTLVSAQDLARDDGKVGIDMFRAARLNDLSQLGDRLIGTTPPLKLRFIADKAKPRSVTVDGKVTFTIGDVGAFAGTREITDPIERNIAWIFMQFGDWPCGMPEALRNGDELEAIEWVFAPKERTNEGQNFEMIGSLSSIFSRYYATQTLDDRGLIQTEAALKPDWFAPLVASELPKAKLPLWRFVIQPNRQFPLSSDGES